MHDSHPVRSAYSRYFLARPAGVLFRCRWFAKGMPELSVNRRLTFVKSLHACDLRQFLPADPDGGPESPCVLGRQLVIRILANRPAASRIPIHRRSAVRRVRETHRSHAWCVSHTLPDSWLRAVVGNTINVFVLPTTPGRRTAACYERSPRAFDTPRATRCAVASVWFTSSSLV